MPLSHKTTAGLPVFLLEGCDSVLDGHLQDRDARLKRHNIFICLQVGPEVAVLDEHGGDFRHREHAEISVLQFLP